MANITAIVVIAVTLAGLALFSMPIPQQASAQGSCGPQGNPYKGAQVTRCSGLDTTTGILDCHFLTTPKGNFNSSCHTSH
jgi:hypothetical protein